MENKGLLAGFAANLAAQAKFNKGPMAMNELKELGPTRTFKRQDMEDKFSSRLEDEYHKRSIFVQDKLTDVAKALDEYGDSPIGNFNPLGLKSIELKEIDWQVLTDNGMHWVEYSRQSVHEILVYQNNEVVHKIQSHLEIVSMWAYKNKVFIVYQDGEENEV